MLKVRKFGQLLKFFKIFIVPSFWKRFYDVTVMLSLVVLSKLFPQLTFLLSYFMPKFVKIECHLHGEKNRSTFKIFRKLSAQDLLIITSLDGFRNSKIGYLSTEADLTLPLLSFSLPTPFTRGGGRADPLLYQKSSSLNVLAVLKLLT